MKLTFAIALLLNSTDAIKLNMHHKHRQDADQDATDAAAHAAILDLAAADAAAAGFTQNTADPNYDPANDPASSDWVGTTTQDDPPLDPAHEECRNLLQGEPNYPSSCVADDEAYVK